MNIKINSISSHASDIKNGYKIIINENTLKKIDIRLAKYQQQMQQSFKKDSDKILSKKINIQHKIDIKL